VILWIAKYPKPSSIL